MSTLNITNLYYEEKEVGKKIKMTKKRYLWEFTLDSHQHQIEMFHSRMSRKKKLVHNGIVVYYEENYKNNFEYFINLGKHRAQIIQLKSDKFELRIDNYNFDMLLLNDTRNQQQYYLHNEQQSTNDTNNFVPYHQQHKQRDMNYNQSKFEMMPAFLRSKESGAEPGAGSVSKDNRMDNKPEQNCNYNNNPQSSSNNNSSNLLFDFDSNFNYKGNNISNSNDFDFDQQRENNNISHKGFDGNNINSANITNSNQAIIQNLDFENIFDNSSSSNKNNEYTMNPNSHTGNNNNCISQPNMNFNMGNISSFSSFGDGQPHNINQCNINNMGNPNHFQSTWSANNNNY